MNDYGPSYDMSAAQSAKHGLIISLSTRRYCGGEGWATSTEHTAYLRLKSGLQAPASGSADVNGQVVAEQIGAQIFIDAWGMVCPGQPQRAADLAHQAASVSHDGEAIYGAQVIASDGSGRFLRERYRKTALMWAECIPTGLSD